MNQQAKVEPKYIVLIVIITKDGKEIERLVKGINMIDLLANFIKLFMKNTRYINLWKPGRLKEIRTLKPVSVNKNPKQKSNNWRRFKDGCLRFKLSPTETVVITMLWKNFDKIEIAELLECDVGTINSHVSHIYDKLNLSEKSLVLAYRAILK